jgi:hypothetical protein
VTLSVERSSAVLVRVWLEGEADRFRARVMAAGEETEGAGGDRTIALASSPVEVLAVVRRWLENFTRHEIAEDRAPTSR